MKCRLPINRGFTLVEMMVVIGIIGLLIGILIPVLSGARNRARIVACGSNVKQIGVAWQTYLVHWNDEFPAQKRTGRNLSWFYGGDEYVTESRAPGSVMERPLNKFVRASVIANNADKVFKCPADREVRNGLTGGQGPTKGQTTFEYYGNSYLMYHRFFKWDDTPNVYKPVKRTMIETPPSQVFMLGDCQWYYSINGAYWDGQFHRQKDYVNALYLDGHSDFIKIIPKTGTTEDYTFSFTQDEMHEDVIWQNEQAKEEG